MFSKFDLDGSGSIDKQEFLAGCTVIGIRTTGITTTTLMPMKRVW